ncbi:hypothetical protein ES703_118362 [subsurface metagenome]
MKQMNRANPEDQFNCGACGYSSCRELAIAICQGLAEVEMCWPYVLEKYYPQLVDNLAPVVSPMMAMGRLIKWQYNPQARVVFIGPCAAKIAEAKDERVAGVVDAVLTFTELKEMLAAKEITPESQEDEQFSGPTPNLGRLFAISGGVTQDNGTY